MDRRQAIKAVGLVGAAACLPALSCAKKNAQTIDFRFCLNTSTIRGQALGIVNDIEIAAKAGYDGVELWIRDVESYIAEGGTLKQLSKQLTDSGIKVENAIGFAPCFVNDDQKREDGIVQLEREMLMMAELGCTRIAAPPAGITIDDMPDWFTFGERYHRILELGKKTGVMPHLEFWGASGTLYQLGQALMVAANANHPDVKLLPDVYHLFRGNSGFEGLKMLSGQLIEVFHVNDYPGDVQRDEQKDAHRVYPGDGVAPLKQILTDLKNMGGEKVLSLELFNPDYWQQDALSVAKTGLEKMKKTVALID